MSKSANPAAPTRRLQLTPLSELRPHPGNPRTHKPKELRKPFAHGLYLSEAGRILAVQVGGPDPQFPGTDRLSMGVQPKAIDWLDQAPAPVLFGEGDRLATKGFLDALEEACDEWWLFHLATPPELAAERRTVRGSKQDPTWLAGRLTKVANLVSYFGSHVTTLDGSLPVEVLARQLRATPPFRWADVP